MTRISSYEPSNNSSTETSNGKGQPSPPPAQLDDDGAKVFRHLTVSMIMFASFFMSTGHVWTGMGHPHHWYKVIVTAIVFLYSTLMIHLLLIRHGDHKKRMRDLQSSQLTSVLMAVVTVIMLISLGVALFVSRPAWSDLASIALMLSLSMGLIFLCLEFEEYERKKKLQEKVKMPQISSSPRVIVL